MVRRQVRQEKLPPTYSTSTCTGSLDQARAEISTTDQCAVVFVSSTTCIEPQRCWFLKPNLFTLKKKEYYNGKVTEHVWRHHTRCSVQTVSTTASRITFACLSDLALNTTGNAFGTEMKPPLYNLSSLQFSLTNPASQRKSNAQSKREIVMNRDASATWLPVQKRRPQPNM